MSSLSLSMSPRSGPEGRLPGCYAVRSCQNGRLVAFTRSYHVVNMSKCDMRSITAREPSPANCALNLASPCAYHRLSFRGFACRTGKLRAKVKAAPTPALRICLDRAGFGSARASLRLPRPSVTRFSPQRVCAYPSFPSTRRRSRSEQHGERCARHEPRSFTPRRRWKARCDRSCAWLAR